MEYACKRCYTSGRIKGLGMIEGKCPVCNGIGYVLPKEAIIEKPKVVEPHEIYSDVDTNDAVYSVFDDEDDALPVKEKIRKKPGRPRREKEID